MQWGNFFKDIFYSSSISIGLDVGDFSVKIAQIKKRLFRKERFLSFAIVPIKGDRSRDRIIEAIRQACQEAAIDSNKVNLSISGPNIMMRYIILPRMKKKDLPRSLEFELEKYIPYKKEEVNIDHAILAKLPNNRMIVLLVAAEHWLIQERVNLIRDANLEPQLINTDVLALAGAFKVTSPRPKGVVALLDVGHRLSELIVLEDDIPCFSRDIGTGEYNIIQMTSEKMDIDFNLAKEWVYQSPANRVKEIIEAIKPELNNLLDELSLSFEYCERNLGKKVVQLYLSGEGSKVKILLESLEKFLNLKIDLWDPTQGFKVSSSLNAEELREYAPLLGVVIGLALS